MTRILSDDGLATAVSVIKIETNRVVQTKTVEVDGYSAVQITTGTKVNKKGEAKVRHVSAAAKGHYAKASQDIGLGLWEFRANIDEIADVKNFDSSIFGAGQYVDVTGQSKGKGYQGGVKRHNFSMQDATHGNSISHRAIGSTGQCQDPGRVLSRIVAMSFCEPRSCYQVDNDRNLLLVKGAIPGFKSGFVKVILSTKKDKINNDISKQIKELGDADRLHKEEAKVTTEVQTEAKDNSVPKTVE